MKKWLLVALSLFLASAVMLSWWSYHLVDPNLTLFPIKVYQTWQESMWQRAGDSVTVAREYAGVMSALWISYVLVLLAMYKVAEKKHIRRILFFWAFIATALFLGHNALSHDIFNYLFNAKMVTVYGANPHVQTALDFAQDPWVRFMHNVHTPAPYAWGWTILSLVPFGASMGKFLLAYFGMKLWMFVGLMATLFFVWKLLETEKFAWNERLLRFSLLAFNPLFLVETLMNGHNDVWMMWPALAGLWLVMSKKQALLRRWVAAFILFGISLSTKYATILVAPVFGVVAARDVLSFFPVSIKWKKRMQQFIAMLLPYWADWTALLLLVPLLTPRSQQFHPWYAIWFLVFLPLCKLRWVQALLVGLSITSTFRYLPWLANGLEYTPLVQLQMRQVTWSGLAVGGIFVILIFLNDRRNRNT